MHSQLDKKQSVTMAVIHRKPAMFGSGRGPRHVRWVTRGRSSELKDFTTPVVLWFDSTKSRGTEFEKTFQTSFIR